MKFVSPQPSKGKEAMVEVYHKSLEQFFPMATDTMCSNMASAVTDQGFWMVCLTFPTHFLQSFFSNLGCLAALTPVEAKAAEIHLTKTAKDLVEGVVAEEQG